MRRHLRLSISSTVFYLLATGCGNSHGSSKAASAPAAASTVAMSMPNGMAMSSPATTATTFHARGRIVHPTFSKSGQGVSVVVDHEDIAGLMSAMRMDFRLADPSDASRLRPGEKIAFDLIEQPEGDYAVAHVVELPADTPLKLAPPTTRP